MVTGLKTARAKSFNVDGMIAMLEVVELVERGAIEELGVAPNIPQKVAGVVCAGARGAITDVGTSEGERKTVLTAKPMINESKATLYIITSMSRGS